MLDHWQANGPPVYMAVAGYLGLIKSDSKSGESKAQSQYGDLNELAAMFGETGGVIQ